jgi:hypothetical protein
VLVSTSPAVVWLLGTDAAPAALCPAPLVSVAAHFWHMYVGLDAVATGCASRSTNFAIYHRLLLLFAAPLVLGCFLGQLSSQP